MGLSFTNNSKPAKQKLGQYAPKPGSHRVSAEQVANRAEATPESRSPGPKGHSNRITSKQPGPRGPWQKTRDADMSEWLAPWPKGGPDSGGQFFKPGR